MGATATPIELLKGYITAIMSSFSIYSIAGNVVVVIGAARGENMRICGVRFRMSRLTALTISVDLEEERGIIREFMSGVVGKCGGLLYGELVYGGVMLGTGGHCAQYLYRAWGCALVQCSDVYAYREEHCAVFAALPRCGGRHGTCRVLPGIQWYC